MRSLLHTSICLVGAAVSVAGCAEFGIGKSEYSCPGIIGGVACVSARDVYQATDDRDSLRGDPTAPKESEASKGAGGDVAASTPAAAAELQQASFRPVVPVMPDNPVPYRKPAVVMRIWVAPWEDAVGDLHMPGTVFTEVEGRKWQLGLENADVETVATPLEPATLLKVAQ